MNAWKMFLPVAAIATIAMAPQDPKTPEPAPAQAPTEQVAAVSIAELHYVPLHGGAPTVVPARNLLEIRLIEDRGQHIRIELSYENGDYSLIEAQSFHLLRNAQSPRPVKLVRCNADAMRFPRTLVQ